jgi:hypothetical protein
MVTPIARDASFDVRLITKGMRGHNLHWRFSPIEQFVAGWILRECQAGAARQHFRRRLA